MTRRERLNAAFEGRDPDRTPILGGWIACPEHMWTVAGVTRQDYWADPLGVSIRAYDLLGMDGLINVFCPKHEDDFRCVDENTYLHARPDLTLEAALEQVDQMPPPEQIEAEFDLEAEYTEFRRSLVEGQARCGDMVWMPAQWGVGGRVSWYGEFGYENFFLILGGHERQARKLMEVGGARGRCRSRLLARAVSEGLYPAAVLMGEDICTQRGPMVSPAFMERYYAPQLSYGLEPLLEAGCKPVWHCDGDVRPLLDMLFECGVEGLQGFQPECGMVLEELVKRRTRDGRRLLIFGPLAVTTELPVLPPAGVRARVRRAIEVCRGEADLVLFTSNTINPDVPLANIRAMYDEVLGR